jgi:hypothetical protein
MPSDQASRHNMRGHTSIPGRDSTVDRQLRPRLSLRRNMAPGRSKVRSPGNQNNTLHSLPPRTELKAREPTKSFGSIWFSFCPHSLLQDKQCSSSYNHNRFLRVLRACICDGETSSLVDQNLHDALIEHRISHFHEPGNVRTNNEIARTTVLFCRAPCNSVDRGHDVAQT